jgi:hypothetical protein
MTEPPPIVRPAEFADHVHALLDEARTFGRKTIEQKVACGKKLIEAFDELAVRNHEARSPKDRLPWSKALKRFGFSVWTARRLMIAARSHNRMRNLHTSPLDAIYDDGIDPELLEGKRPCRPCRINGKEFSRKCASCRALNRPVSLPKDPLEPVLDMDGNTLPENLIEVFEEATLIRDFNGYLATGAKALKGLVERPGCAALNLAEIQKRLRSLWAFAWKYRPGLPCPECKGQKCDKCGQRGFRTVMEVMDERAAESNANNREKAKAWRARQAARSQPIPG